jgi:hypothetical protein
MDYRQPRKLPQGNVQSKFMGDGVASVQLAGFG